MAESFCLLTKRSGSLDAVGRGEADLPGAYARLPSRIECLLEVAVDV